jgi:hypothetical protein
VTSLDVRALRVSSRCPQSRSKPFRLPLTLKMKVTQKLTRSETSKQLKTLKHSPRASRQRYLTPSPAAGACLGLDVVSSRLPKGAHGLSDHRSTERKRNKFFTIHDAATGLIFEVWAFNEKTALAFGRFRRWALSRNHEGLRRILTPTEPYPTLKEEANYLTAAREQAGRAATALVKRKQVDSQHRAERAAAEEAAYAARLVAMQADQANRRERRAALDARLGRTRPIPSLPTQDPDTREWI